MPGQWKKAFWQQQCLGTWSGLPAYNAKKSTKEWGGKEHETEKKQGRKEKDQERLPASIVLIVVVLGFMIWCAMEGFAADVFYYVPIGVFLVVYLLPYGLFGTEAVRRNG